MSETRERLSEPKFTPGPWSVGEREWKDNGRASWLEIPVGPEGETTALTYCSEDAALIATAPRLYEALEALVAWSRADDTTVSVDGLTVRATDISVAQVTRLLANADAALAKARGEA